MFRAMEIEKAGRPNSSQAVTVRVRPIGRVNWWMKVTLVTISDVSGERGYKLSNEF